MGLLFLLSCLFGFDALRSVGNTHQALLGNQLACGLADAIGLVLNTHQSHLKVTDELQLVCGQTAYLLLRESSSTLLQHLECWRRILRVV